MSRLPVFLFGALPAAFLALGALTMGLIAFSALANDPLSGLGLLAWSVAGLLGTYGIWRAGFGRRSYFVLACLAAGIVADLPLAIMLLDAMPKHFFELEMLGWTYVVYGPFVVGLLLLVDGLLPVSDVEV